MDENAGSNPAWGAHKRQRTIMALEFTDPRSVAVYIDRFEARSVLPLQAYLHENAFTDEPTINRVNREELDWMVIDEKKDRLYIDAAVYATHQKNEMFSNVIILSEVQTEQDIKDNKWTTKVLAILPNKIAANNLAKQITGEAAIAFSVVK
ncbi:hypothetical protein SEA_BIG4_174 [Microbacterium phage Big4]|nr:hypothetical protein SEA_BIG4_174 [Microbacterium phage Big4]